MALSCLLPNLASFFSSSWRSFFFNFVNCYKYGNRYN
jgi:hypothetical protein